MPFDINNAVVVEDVPVTSAPAAPPKPKFDLNNAIVVDDKVPIQHTFRENTNQVVAAPYGLRANEIEDLDDYYNQNPSPFEEYFLDPVARGFINISQNVSSAAYKAGIYSDETFARIVAETEGGKEKVAPSPEVQQQMSDILSSESFGDALKNIVTKPAGFYNLLLESGVSSGPSVAAGFVGPKGSSLKAMIGRGAAFGTGSGAQEYAASLLDMMNRRNVDMKDEAAIRAVLKDPDFIREANERGLKRGVIIGMVDAVSAGLAGKIGPAVGGGIRGAATEVGAQAISGGGGEALAQIATDGKITSPAEVLLEGAAEAVTGIPEIMMGREAGKVRVPKDATPAQEMEAASVPLEKAQAFYDSPDSKPSPKTETPQFKAWFGDSKVVSPEGKPLVVYHGTKANIEAFDPAKKGTTSDSGYMGKGFYFTPEPALASLYSKKGRGTSNENVMPVYVSIKNPLTDLSLIQEEVQSRVNAELSDRIKNETNEFLSADQIEANLRSDKTTEVAMEMGYDGIIAPNPRNPLPGGKPEYVAFSPNQIKSVFNSGKFDATSSSLIDQQQEGESSDIQGSVGQGAQLETPVNQGPGEERDADILPSTATAATDGGGSRPPTDGGGVASGSPEPDRESDYATVAATPPAPPPSRIGALIQDAGETANDWFVPMSTRLGNIHQSLKHAVRRFTFNVGLHTHNDKETVQPFIEGVSDKMSEGDYRILDLALKNGDRAKVDQLMEQYGLAEEYAKVRALLEKIHADAKESGMEVGHIENYFPRKVRRGKSSEYMAFLRNQQEWSYLQQAMDREDPNNTMTDEEKAEFANLWLRGYKNDTLQLSRSGNAKERSIDYITPDMNAFYEDSMPTLINYISGMRYQIETHKLFGKSETDTDENIGAYVLRLIEQGIISRDQELEVRKILKAVVNPTGTHGIFSALKNSTYIYTMGSPISALTQLGDLAFSLYHNGYYQTGVSVLKAATNNAAIKRDEVGISDILQEFEDNSSSGKAVRKVFSAVGLARMDRFGKEVLMDGAITNLRKQANKPTQAFTEQMEMIFGTEAQTVIDDLKAGRKTENVLYLAYSELAEFQPVSIAEMPVTYANSGNGRILYMLKSYTIKQIDTYRREVFSKLASGNVKETAKGLKNLVTLGSALMLMGMSSDALKDLLLGRDIELDDLVMDNVLKTMGFTKYQIYQIGKDGFFTTFWKSLFVPAAMADDVMQDMYDLATDEKDIDEVRSVTGVPVVGKFYYWWAGAGTEE